MIQQSSVEEVLQTAKIEDVVGDYVNLKRRGTNLIGLCPFHSEKTPSFNVNPARNIYKCFGCGKAGDPVAFLREHDSLSFVEAIRQIAKKYGIQLEEVQVSDEVMEERRAMDGLYLVNEYAQQYFEEQLFKTDEGRSVGLSYFRERGFREDVIKKFGLGYTTEQRDDFFRRATTDQYPEETLDKLGLIRNKRDFFRGRVMFTIHNLSGKPVAFAGRIMRKNVKAPKYINSPETEIYNKSKTLYGLYFAKTPIRKNDEVILVEGYTDVISLHQNGIENVVASSGTSLTEGQIDLIRRFTDNVKVLYDGDAAGTTAALRGLDMLLARGLNVRLVMLPEGEDPDSYVNKLGATKFGEFIDAQAKDFILFKTNLLLSEVGGDPLKKAGLIKDIVGSIALIPDAIKRDVYLRECARLLTTDLQILAEEVTRQRQINEQKERNAAIRAKRRADRDRTRRNDGPQRNAPPSHDPSFPSDPGFPDEPGYGPPPGTFDEPGRGTTGQRVPRLRSEVRTSTNEYQERDVVRLLVEFGEQIYDAEDELSVAEYIISNVDDLMDYFDNDLYARMVKFGIDVVNRKEQLTSRHFTSHQDSDIAQTAANLLSEKVEMSEGWAEREIFLTTQKPPEQNFGPDSRSSLLRFRLHKLEKMEADARKKLTKVDDFTTEKQIEKMLKLVQRVQTLRQELAAELGTVVYK